MSGLQPDQRDLLDVARSTFVDELLPLLPQDKRLTGLMVANALGIARRMLDAGDAEESDVAQLCEDIRAGSYDGDDTGRLRTRLIGRTLVRLAISSPKLVPAAEQALRANVRPHDL